MQNKSEYWVKKMIRVWRKHISLKVSDEMHLYVTESVVQTVLNTLLSIASAPLSQFLWTSFCFNSLQQRAPTYFSWKSRLFS